MTTTIIVIKYFNKVKNKENKEKNKLKPLMYYMLIL